MAFDGFRHHLSICVTGHADKVRHLLISGLHQTFKSALWRFDSRQVIFLTKAVNVDEVHVISIQPLETSL